LCIDDWDFNWQDIYEFAKPVRLPKGTRLALTGVHDNSAENPLNPKNPPERMRWGEQTFNEMSLAFVNLMPLKESDLIEAYARKDRHFGAAIVPALTQAALDKLPRAKKESKDVDFVKRAREVMPAVDTDGNGKLSVDEIIAAVGSRTSADEIRKRFPQYDRDGDKQLDASEVAEVLRGLSKL
jgi:Ca2+-binding EF-hand superfamily protein